MTFERAIELVLKSEGGYVNDPNDRGGETNFGISKRSYPHVDIKNLTREKAIAIYKRDFWDALSVERLPDLIRFAYFDAAVNCGPGNAAKFLQESLGVKIDGAIGPVTISKAQSVDPFRLFEDFLWLRVRHHTRLARDHKSQLGFLPGWILRIISVRKESLV